MFTHQHHINTCVQEVISTRIHRILSYLVPLFYYISPKSKVQSPKSKVQSPKSKVQSPKSKVQSPKSHWYVVLYLIKIQLILRSLIITPDHYKSITPKSVQEALLPLKKWQEDPPFLERRVSNKEAYD